MNQYGINQRIVCWFSCGAASAVATKLILSEKLPAPVVVAYTHVVEEHSDNSRFLSECERWFGQSITILRNEKYGGSIYEVFRQSQYLVGPAGAPCTKKLKREMREAFQLPDDTHVIGYTAEEKDRADQFVENNDTLNCRFPLIERHLTKADCLGMIDAAGIALPAMYRLGYDHNNCVGCVKGGMGYWNKVRVDFPETFGRMAKTERQIGASIIRVNKESVFLDELDPKAGYDQPQPSIECGIFCEMAKAEYSN